MRSFRFLIIPMIFMLNCLADNVKLVLAPGFVITKQEMKCISELSIKLGFDSAYEIEASIFWKYDSSKAIAVKQVVLENDTIRKEKWLYLWRQDWTNSQLYRMICDSSHVCPPFVTGYKAIRTVNKYIYRHFDREKVFRLLEPASYNDVRAILDCVLNDRVVIDSTNWDNSYRRAWRERFKEKWEFFKINMLDFVSVMKLFEGYMFCFTIPEKNGWEFVVDVKRTPTGCELNVVYDRPITL